MCGKAEAHRHGQRTGVPKVTCLTSSSSDLARKSVKRQYLTAMLRSHHRPRLSSSAKHKTEARRGFVCRCEVLYFAYGANTSTATLRLRGVTPLSAQPATAAGQIAFRHRGGFATLLPDESGTAAAAGEAPGGLAYCRPQGVLLELTRWDLAKLTAFEAGYLRQRVAVVTAEGAAAQATAFVSSPALRLPESVPPRRRYRDLLLAGAAEHGSSLAYREWLARLPVAEDWALVGPEYFVTPSEQLALLAVGAAASVGLLWFLSATRRRRAAI